MPSVGPGAWLSTLGLSRVVLVGMNDSRCPGARGAPWVACAGTDVSAQLQAEVRGVRPIQPWSPSRVSRWQLLRRGQLLRQPPVSEPRREDSEASEGDVAAAAAGARPRIPPPPTPNPSL